MDYRRILTIMVGINVRSSRLKEYPIIRGWRSMLAQNVVIDAVTATTAVALVRTVVNIGLCATLAV